MTHEDILKKVQRDQAITEYLNKGLMKGDIAINVARQHWFQSNALLAVVELHKPEHSIAGYRCTHCTLEVTYPCPTIQTIEKELA